MSKGLEALEIIKNIQITTFGNSDLIESAYKKEVETIKQSLLKAQEQEKLLEKYEIEDLAELEIALDQYYHRCDNVQTRRVNDNETSI